MTTTATDCQGFAGGFTLGVVQAGFKLIAKREHPAGFGVPNCENNRHLLGTSWETQCSDGAQWEPLPTDLVFGNPPCSGFSVASNQDFRGADSPINSCMWDLIQYAARCDPYIVAFESVQPAFQREDGRRLMQALRADLEERTGHRWNLHHVKHDAYALGGCATRRRYFFVAARIPFGVDPTPVDSFPTFWDAIMDLSDLDLAWESQRYRGVHPSTWVRDRELRNGAHHVDGMATSLNPDSPKGHRLQAIWEEGEWYPGETDNDAAKRYYERHGDLPEAWQSQKERHLKKDFSSGYFPTIRWKPDNPARVIHGGSVDSVIHPYLNRTITHREAARVMGFPDDWRIEPLRDVRGAHNFWGKGITVQCGRWLGGWIKQSIEGNPGEFAGDEVGDREYLIDVKPRKRPKREET